MKIAILGGGNSAYTMAADIALRGFEVTLCDLPAYKENIEPLIKDLLLEKVGSAGTMGKTGIAKLTKVTTDLADTIKKNDTIMLAVPAYGHSAFFEALNKNLEDGQIVIILPGNWGAIRLFNFLKKTGFKKKIYIGETDCCMHICRAGEPWLGPFKTRVILERTSVKLSAMPASDTEIIWETMKRIYPQASPARSVIETSLGNSNSIIHGPVVLMNAGWIEHTSGQFMIYRDGVTPAVGSIVDAIADERDLIIKKVGLEPSVREPFYNKIKNSAWCKDPCETGPGNLEHRYLREDIPYGLVPMTCFGDLLGVSTPVSDAVIEIASRVNNSDYRENGLTMRELGLDKLEFKEILHLVETGRIL